MMREKRILLVEDNPDDIELTLRALNKSKIVNEVVVAHDGTEALELLFEGPLAEHPPEIILLDLKLPKMDGFEVLRRIRAEPKTKRLPVVVLTSSTEEGDLVTSYDHGANSFIHKPVDFEQFTESVRQLGLYWLVLNVGAPAPGRA